MGRKVVASYLFFLFDTLFEEETWYSKSSSFQLYHDFQKCKVLFPPILCALLEPLYGLVVIYDI